MKTAIIVTIVGMVTGVLIVFMINGGGRQFEDGNNVTVVQGKQVIEIMAKGGYTPRITQAKANIPTVLKVNTRGTFDCSASLTIPSLKYYTLLSPSDVTEIEIPSQKPGVVLQGLCSMGMYSFQINFS